MDHSAEENRRTPAVARAGFLCCLLLSAATGTAQADARFEVPAWLFPVPAPNSDRAPAGTVLHESSLLHVPGSDVGYTRAQLRNFFAVPDWHADARLATDLEVAEAAAYYSSLALSKPRAMVVEAERVPRTRAIAYVHEVIAGGGEEPLGDRLLEVPRDFERHELRDARVEYVAYVPRGSIERG